MVREMTRKQFQARLKHYGFRQVLMWFEHKDHPNISVGGLFYRDGKLARRATLAKLLDPKTWESRA